VKYYALPLRLGSRTERGGHSLSAEKETHEKQNRVLYRRLLRRPGPALCLTTVLAASGKVSYNFANVSMDGTQKITAGQDITAANGQKIPGSILYTDAAGGKTNYLPIRTISELLGTEIGYDSASKTVLLGKQPAAEPAPEENVIDLRTPKTVPENPRRGDVLREQTAPCQGHLEGMTMEEVMRTVEEGRLW